MIYLLLIYADEADWTTKSAAEMEPTKLQHQQLEDDLRCKGKYLGCGGLAPTSAATTLRLSGGKSSVTAGPYAQTKEQLGGYYLIDVESLDEAMAFAERIPALGNRAVEIRPVMDYRS